MFKVLDLTFTGGSHEEYVGLIVNNLPKGIIINKELIEQDLLRRRPKGLTNTPRVELDEYEFISGVINNTTNGDTLELRVYNKNYNKCEYNSIVRPNHVDLEKYLKYNGNVDLSGGGNSSGRMTVVLVILGSILKQVINNEFNICVNSEIKTIGEFEVNSESISSDILEKLDYNDSYGGIVRLTIKNKLRGIGEAYFNSLKSYFSSLLFYIPTVSGVSYGDLDLYKHKGSEILDEPYIINNEIKYKANHLGGIVGGMTNGNDIIINVYLKPIPSIKKEVSTIDLDSMSNVNYTFNNRSDILIVDRIQVVLESMIYIGLYDLLLSEGIIK